MTTFATNKELNGVEIYFDIKPSEEVRNQLKALKFRWHKIKKCWYAKQNYDTLKIAQDLSEGKSINLIDHIEIKDNPNSLLQVGDILYYSWGYDQTNIDFFQVVSVSKSGKTCTIQEMSSEHVEDKGWMQWTVKPGQLLKDCEPMRKVIKSSSLFGGVYLNMPHGCCSLYNGKPKLSTHYA